jgi:THO complex subunit 2
MVLGASLPYLSRNILISPHCNPRNPGCVDVLTTAYHTLLSSTLLTFFPKPTLTPAAFVDFVRSVLNNLPSSSQSPPQSTQHATVFGEHLVDMIWSLDAQLDEITADAKLSISNLSNEQEKSNNVLETLVKVQKVKTNAESDKESVQVSFSHALFRITESSIPFCVVNVLTLQFSLELG